MTALDALKEPKRIERRIFELLNQIDEARSRLMPGGVNYELDKVQAAPGDKFAEVMAQIDELERKLDKLANELEKSRARVPLLLEQVTSKDAKMIINLHDVIGLPMDDVAEGMYMSRALCYILRNRGLSEITLDTLDTGFEYNINGEPQS